MSASEQAARIAALEAALQTLIDEAVDLANDVSAGDFDPEGVAGIVNARAVLSGNATNEMEGDQ